MRIIVRGVSVVDLLLPHGVHRPSMRMACRVNNSLGGRLNKVWSYSYAIVYILSI